MVSLFPEQPHIPQPAGPGATAGDAFALIQLHRFAAENARVRIEPPSSGLISSPSPELRAVALGPLGEELVTYSLNIAELPNETQARVSQLITQQYLAGNAPIEVLRELHAVTFSLTHQPWRTAVINPNSTELERTQEMSAVVPSLSEFLADPLQIGTRYQTALRLGATQVQLEARIRPELNVVDFTVSDLHTESRPTLEVYQVSGSLSRYASVERRIADLQTVVWRAMERLWDDGLSGFRQHMAITDWLSAPRVELPSGATLELRLEAKKSFLTLTSAPPSEEAIRGRSVSWYRWIFNNGDHPEDLQLQLAKAVSALQTVLDPGAQRQVLATLSENFSVCRSRPAPVERVLGAELASAITDIPELSLAPLAVSTLDQQVDLLQGFVRAKITLHPSDSLTRNPQILNSFEVATGPSGDFKIKFSNEINNTLEAAFTAQSRYDPSNGDDSILQLAELMAQQVRTDAPWVHRCSILRTLEAFRTRDPRANRVFQNSLASFPHFLDEQCHRLIDAVAAPFISMFKRLGHSPHTTSHVGSIRPGSLRLALGAPSEAFQLALTFDGFYLTQVAVTPYLRRGHQSLSKSLPTPFIYQCNIAVADADIAKRSPQILNTLVKQFRALTHPHSSRKGKTRRFEGSALQVYLEQIGRKVL
jgi:hypothetical protein